MDGDRRYRTPAKREAERAKWVNVLRQALAPEVRTEAALAEIDSLVVVEVWGDGVDFERAHFSDRELAVAIRAVGQPPDNVPDADLERQLALSRTQGTNLDIVWAGWP